MAEQKVKILVTAPGSPDHMNTYTYMQGETYVVGSPMMPEELALAFADVGVVELPSGMEKKEEAVGYPSAKATSQAQVDAVKEATPVQQEDRPTATSQASKQADQKR